MLDDIRHIEKPYVFSDLTNLDQPMVIEASAGTGKTYTLEHLVFDHLVTKRIPISELLVVTFTDRATNELKQRIRSFLTRVVNELLFATQLDLEKSYWEIDDDALRFINRQLFNFNQAPIYTIHSFCNGILKEQAFYLDNLLEQEHHDQNSLFNQALDAALFSKLTSDDELSEYARVWFENYKRNNLSEYIFPVFPTLDDLTPEFHEETLIKTFNNIREIYRKYPTPDSFSRFTHSLLKHIEYITADKNCDVQYYRALEKFPHAFRIINAAVVKNISLPEFLRGIAVFNPGGDHSASFELFHQLGYIVNIGHRESLLNNDERTVIESVLKILRNIVPFETAIIHKFKPHIEKELERIKSTGKFDFEDLSLKIYNHLKSNPKSRLLTWLRNKYKVAFIDEFQDTDAFQWYIFKKVFLDSPTNNIFLIGDPKQGIYTFRRADIHVYTQAVKTIEKEGKVLRLTKNFRSSLGMTQTINTFFNQKIAEPVFYGNIHYDTPVICAKPNLSLTNSRGEMVPATTIFTYEKSKEKRSKLSLFEYNKLHRRTIADEIYNILYQDHLYVSDFDPNEDEDTPKKRRRIRANNIFILVSRDIEARDIAAELAARHIPYALPRKEGLFQGEEAEAILQLLRAIQDPDNIPRRLNAWQTPFFDIPLEQFSYALWAPETQPHQSLFFMWKEIADRLDFNALFASIIQETGINQRAIFFGNNQRQMTNISHIFEILRDEATLGHLNLDTLVERLDAFINKTAQPRYSDRNNERSESSADTVQIMTIFKAKGLQADVVFFYGGTSTYFADSITYYYHDVVNGTEKRIKHLGKALDLKTKVNICRESYEEKQRLIYVALTRARVKLYIPYIDPNTVRQIDGMPLRGQLEDLSKKGGKARPVASYTIPAICVPLQLRLQRLLGEVKGNANFALQPMVEGADPYKILMTMSKSQLDTIHSWRLPKLHSDRSKEFIENLPLLEPVITSYSQLKSNRQKGTESDGVGVPVFSSPLSSGALEDGVLPSGAASGVYLHELLEKLPFSHCANIYQKLKGNAPEKRLETFACDPVIHPLVTSISKKYGIEDHYLSYVFRLLEGTLFTPIPHISTQSPTLNHPFSICEIKNPLKEVGFHFTLSRSELEGVGINISNSENFSQKTDFRYEDGYVKGYIDLLFQHDGKAYFIDWKSDLIPSYEPKSLDEHVASHYHDQAKLYTIALVKMLRIVNKDDYNERIGGFLYVFLRGISPYGDGFYYGKEGYEELLEMVQMLSITFENQNNEKKRGK